MTTYTLTVWTNYTAIAAIEGFDGEEHDEDELLEAWQHLINTGAVWRLQGFYGHQAAALIDQGLCTPAVTH